MYFYLLYYLFKAFTFNNINNFLKFYKHKTIFQELSPSKRKKSSKDSDSAWKRKLSALTRDQLVNLFDAVAKDKPAFQQVSCLWDVLEPVSGMKGTGCLIICLSIYNSLISR